MTDLHVDDRYESVRARVDAFLTDFAAEVDSVDALDRGTSDDTPLGEPRWYLRLRGEAKEVTTIWFTLGQRTLRFETYVLPSPPEHRLEVYESVLRRNGSIVGASYCIGDEDAIFLRGELPLGLVSDAELDRVIGTVFATVERDFPHLVRRAFASRLGG